MSKESNDNNTMMGMSKPILFIMAIAGLGGFLYGFDIGIISGALVFMKESITITPGTVGLSFLPDLGAGPFFPLLPGHFLNVLVGGFFLSFSRFFLLLAL